MRTHLLIGEILKPQGIRGEVKLRPYFADEEAFLEWKTLYLKKKDVYEPIACKGNRMRDGFAFTILGDCANADDAEKLRGELLYIDREHASELPEGDVYISDLIGCKAVTADGKELATLKDVLQYGPVDTWVFSTKKGEMMAPALKHVFLKADPEQGIILTDEEKLAEVAVYAD